MSTETTVFSVRMDARVKDSLDAFCATVGMNTNTAINMFARVVTREKRLPFEVAIDQFYDERNIKHLLKVKAEVESGEAKLIEHELIEVDND
jgi:DNA-damage-inducible protein J